MLYLAYGSNLNKSQMSRRCPAAVPIGPVAVPHARLVFRGVADVETSDSKDDIAACGLWHITRQCERELDRYEGVSGGLYRKEYLTLGLVRSGKMTKEPALIYLMNRTGYEPPGRYYYDVIAEGYRDFKMDDSTLIEATAMFPPVDPAPRRELWDDGFEEDDGSWTPRSQRRR